MEPVFKVGDQVTYLYRRDVPNGEYKFGGDCRGGMTGVVLAVVRPVPDRGCHMIRVSLDDKYKHDGIPTHDYNMLECEFEEYPHSTSSIPRPIFRVGDVVTYLGHPYKFGGESRKGLKGTVRNIDRYIADRGCYEILVDTIGGGRQFSMLECEFEEYTKPGYSGRPEPKFKVGQTLTYKYSPYHYGGHCRGGLVGKVDEIGPYNADLGCFDIHVTCENPKPGMGSYTYTMLESEFQEYGTPKESIPDYRLRPPKFRVGDTIRVVPGGVYYCEPTRKCSELVKGFSTNDSYIGHVGEVLEIANGPDSYWYKLGHTGANYISESGLDYIKKSDGLQATCVLEPGPSPKIESISADHKKQAKREDSLIEIVIPTKINLKTKNKKSLL